VHKDNTHKRVRKTGNPRKDKLGHSAARQHKVKNAEHRHNNAYGRIDVHSLPEISQRKSRKKNKAEKENAIHQHIADKAIEHLEPAFPLVFTGCGNIDKRDQEHFFDFFSPYIIIHFVSIAGNCS